MPETISPPPANSPEARTPTGEIKDVSQTQSTETPTPTPASSTTSSTTEPAPSDPAPAPDPAAGVPDTYNFAAPEGTTLDKAVTDAATPIFRELGLNQAAADKLVAFYNQQMKAQADIGVKAVLAMREKWVGEAKSDPALGPKLEQIKADVARAYDVLGDPKLVSDFKDAMNLTGAGDNPAFIKAFHKLAQLVIEGKPVSGGGPSPHGQTNSGRSERPSIASAMYPNLVRQ